VGAITLFVLLEKIMPWGGWMSRLTGLLLAVCGAANLFRMI
jgi:predicted metal-binding membrane protein